MKHHLEQQVAQLIADLQRIPRLDGVGDLVSLLDGKRRDGGEGLLHVPRTAALGITQPRHELQQRSHGPLSLTHHGSCSNRNNVNNMPAVAPQMLRSP
jgi:hypothetical protein